MGAVATLIIAVGRLAYLYDFHLAPGPVLSSLVYEYDPTTLYDFGRLYGANKEVTASWRQVKSQSSATLIGRGSMMCPPTTTSPTKVSGESVLGL